MTPGYCFSGPRHWIPLGKKPPCLNPPEGIEWGMPYPGQSSYRLRAIMIPGGLFLNRSLPLSGGLQH